MGDLSVVINEKINLKIIKENPEYILKYENNFFLSDIGKSLFETYKLIYFDKQMELNDQNILLFGNTNNNDINESIITKINEINYDLNKFDEYYFKLKDEFIKDKISNNIVNDIIIESQTKNNLDITKINKIIAELQNNVSILSGTSKLFKTPEQMLNNYEYELKQRLEGKVYSLGCSHLDKKVLLGARPGLITSIFASTGLGKSSYSLFLDNKRLNKLIPSLHISLENDNFLTTERTLSMRWQRDIRQYYNSEEESLQEELKFLLEKERKRVKKTNKYLFVEEAGLKIDDAEYLIIEAKKIMGTNYLVCTIDLASMLSDFGTTPDVIEQSMNRLHNIARRQNVHLILVIQANRKNEDIRVNTIDDIEKLKPNLGNIKNSGAIAERSRVVLGLHRKKHYMLTKFPDDPRTRDEEDIVEILLLKQNAGPLSLLKYLFVPEYTWFIPYFQNSDLLIKQKDSKENE